MTVLFLICPFQDHIQNYDLGRVFSWLLKYLRRVESSCRLIFFRPFYKKNRPCKEGLAARTIKQLSLH